MTDLEDFLMKVLPFAPGCPEPTAIEHIRNAAIEFCEETRLWRSEDTFEVADDPNIVCTPQGAVIQDIERCDFDGQKLEPVGVGWLDEHYPDWRSDTFMTEGRPKFFTQTRPDTVRVVPSKPGRVKVWLRLKPAEDAEQVPDFIATQHRNTIGWGALAGILMLPNQTFSNPNSATYFQAKFDQSLGRKSKLKATGQQRAPIRTKAQFF